MSALAVDIETVPTKAALTLAYPADDRQPPSNYKNADTIAAWREADERAWMDERIKTYSLDPRYGRVVAIGLAWEDRQAIGSEPLVAATEADEVDVLRALWRRVVSSEPLVTWNGLGFDVPFLLVRSALLGVETPRLNLMRRYDTRGHYDVKAVLYQWDQYRMNKKGNGLGEWAQAFGLTDKVAHGSEVYQMFRDGRLDEIGAYAAGDARLTMALYHKVAFVFG